MAPVDPVPLVIVEGFLSSAGALVWGNFEEHSNAACRANGEQDRRTIFASVGAVSSLHDRACELFYSLVGGTVDYGAKHAHDNRHGRYGRTHENGLYPQWSPKHPLHFLGHSMGGPTITKLQWLIATGFFGKDYDPDMILSVNTVSAPFRGTQLVYALGEDTRDAPNVRPLSAGNLLAKGIHVVSYLSPVLPSFLDLHVEARGLSYYDSSFASFLKQLWRSDWAESRDATPYDATFLAADEREAAQEGAVYPNTYYRSYCATLNHTHSPSVMSDLKTPTLLQAMSAWPLYFASRSISTFPLSGLRPVPSFLTTVSSTKLDSSDRHGEGRLEDGLMHVDGSRTHESSALRANDGVVPLFSQWHPHDCNHTRCVHFSHVDNIVNAPSDHSRYDKTPDAGIWHVHHLDNAHHFSIVPIWMATQSQRAFWIDLGHWLRAAENARRTDRSRAVTPTSIPSES